MEALYSEALAFLRQLIATPSFSREEKASAEVIETFLRRKNISFKRKGNNIWAQNCHFDPALPTILLNSHHDTVSPAASYTVNPFGAAIDDGKLFGLGSNDAGASLVGLWAAFVYFYDKKLKYNLIFAPTAEEEVSGDGGIRLILPELGDIDFAIVGEPTGMQLAIAEKGLVVLDCVVEGTASHAAYPNDDNPIYKAMSDIGKVERFRFPKESTLLGPVKTTVTIVNAGSVHNVVPDCCRFTIDVRTNEHYANDEIVAIMQALLTAEVKPRSLRLNSSHIAINHPVVASAKAEGCLLYGSPTLSDQSVMPFDSVKLGIGDSQRSHTADEFIYLDELYKGIDKYIAILKHLL